MRQPIPIHSGQSLARPQCPRCRAPLDGWAGAEEGDLAPALPQPSAGDPSCCGYCGTILVFTGADGGLRLATDAERELFLQDELFVQMRRFALEHVFSNRRFH